MRTLRFKEKSTQLRRRYVTSRHGTTRRMDACTNQLPYAILALVRLSATSTCSSPLCSLLLRVAIPFC